MDGPERQSAVTERSARARQCQRSTNLNMQRKKFRWLRARARSGKLTLQSVAQSVVGADGYGGRDDKSASELHGESIGYGPWGAASAMAGGGGL